MIATTIWFWLAFVGFVLAMLALDLGVFHRKVHEVRAFEATIWTAIWVGLALLFALGLGVAYGKAPALTFLTGYVVEESLSIDNIFVMVLIFEYFRVPKVCHHRVLFYGILGALVMRGVFIGAGALLLQQFQWIIYIFGALLIVTGIRMVLKQDEEFDGERNPIVRVVRRFVPLSAEFHGKKVFAVENGRILATPLLLVLVLVEFTDLIFAVDSIPAIFGVTQDPFLVFTSNIFAVLGLRTMYFLLASVVDRFYLLKYGLAVVLTFVGAKMLGQRWFHVDIVTSLKVVLIVLVVSIGASLLWPQGRRAATAGGETGSVFAGRTRRRRGARKPGKVG